MRPGGDNRFGRVAVLMGGRSAEREVSLMSGKEILSALQQRGVDAEGVDLDAQLLMRLQQGDFDRVFIALHGRGGEDGTIQAVLQSFDIPYTGSGVLGSALCMDKHRSKLLWKAENLPTPAWMLVSSEQQCQQAVEAFALPMMIKPTMEGSSIGISKVIKTEDVAAAWQLAEPYGEVIAERFIAGEEYTAAILDGRALPIVKLSTPNTFYDYEAKYLSDTTEYQCPCGLDAGFEQQLQAMCLKAFDVLAASGWGRVDFRLDEAQQPWLIEVNTAPGMTGHSLVPISAQQDGMEFGDLVVAILETTLGAADA